MMTATAVGEDLYTIQPHRNVRTSKICHVSILDDKVRHPLPLWREQFFASFTSNTSIQCADYGVSKRHSELSSRV